jgi:alginate O-acetyltransferase complex protein AlgJ
MRKQTSEKAPPATNESTIGSRLLLGLPGAFLIGLLVAGLALSAADPATFATPSDANPVNGGWTASWRASYEQKLPGKEAAVAAWAAMRYALFFQGEPGVLVGRDGWLYSNEELFSLDPSGRALEAAVDQIRAVRDALAARDISLVVALVPTKVVVCAEHLGRYRLPTPLRERYGAARRAIGSLGVAVPDLLTPLREAAARGDVFLRTDTHWTAFGASIAAQALAKVVKPELDARGSSRARYTTQRGEPRERRGDLLSFLPLGRFAATLGPAPDLVADVVTVADGDGGPGLFGALKIPVALVGTSYSAAGAWNFDGALKEELRADVLKVAEEGRGPFVPMRKYLESPAIDDPRPDVVIWEIPERYLGVSTPLGVSPK